MSTQSAEWKAVSRLLRRTGFGTTGTAVDAVLEGKGTKAFVDGILATDFPRDPGATATPLPDVRITASRPTDGAGIEVRERYQKRIRARQVELTTWWLRRMIAVEQPLVEKLTFLWHNHFATSLEKVRYPSEMAAQNEKIRALCLGNFRLLALSMLTDAAMIRWLDGDTNRLGSPNENLAREFMELFTLGHGNGYTETDVREGARALTGWTLRNGTAVLIDKRHDQGKKSVLSKTGQLDAVDFCDAVLNHPKSAKFVVSSLWRQLSSDKVLSQATANRLLSAYGSERDLRSLTRAVLVDPEFNHPDCTVVIGPTEWLVGFHRALRIQLDDTERAKRASRTLKALGQLPFYPPSVGGWPGERSWLSAAAAGIRLRTAIAMVKDADVSAVEDASPKDRLEAVAYLLGIGGWSNSSADALRALVKNPPVLVAAAANTPEYLVS